VGVTHDIDVLQVAYILHLTLDKLKDDAKESNVRDTGTGILLIRLTSDASAPICQWLLSHLRSLGYAIPTPYTLRA
jgi:hypothetical protein